MVYKKFKPDNILINRVVAYPKVEFFVNSGSQNSVYYNRNIVYASSSVPNGSVGLNVVVNNRDASLASTQVQPIFYAPLTSSGVSQLDTNLTINNTTVSAEFVYRAQDIVGTSWSEYFGAGDTFAVTGPGNPPIAGREMPFTDGTEGVVGGTGKYYISSGTTLGNVGTDDFIVEMVLKGETDSRFIFDNRARSTDGTGWSIYYSSSKLYITIDGGGTQVDLATNNTILDGSWHHVIIFVNRDSATGCRFFIDGVANGAANASAYAATSLDNSENKAIFATNQGASAATSTEGLAYFAVWKQANLMDGPNDSADTAAVAAERYNKLVGIYPQISNANSAPVYTRATTATVDIIDETTDIVTLHTVPSGWPRIAKRKDLSGSYVSGYLSERQSTNVLVRSEDFNTQFSTKIEATVSSSVEVAPNGETTADGIVPSSANVVSHYLQYGQSVVNGEHNVFSCYCKQGPLDTGSVTVVNMENANVSGARMRYNLKTNSWHFIGGGVNSYGKEELGNGWVRLWLNYTITSTDGEDAIRMSPLHVSNSVYAGDDVTPAIYTWGAQIEVVDGVGVGPSSYIKTEGTTATRIEDTLTYSASSNVGATAGSVVASILVPNYDMETNFGIVEATDDAGDFIRVVGSFSSGDVARFVVKEGGVNQCQVNGTTVISNGVEHTVAGQYTEDSFKLYVNSVEEGTPDTSGVVTTSLSTIYVGTTSDVTPWATNGLVHSVKFYDVDTEVA